MVVLFNCIFYSVWYDNFNNIILDIDKYQPEKIIILGGEEWCVDNILPSESFFDIEKIIIEKGIRLIFILGSADINFFDKKSIPKTSEIIIWPMFWLHNIYDILYDKLFNYETSYNIDKLFISLNNRTHYHRCQLMDDLAKHSLLSYGNISFIDIDNGYNKVYDWKYWNEKQLVLDEKYLEDKNQYLIPDEYKKSFVNLISESTIKTQFYTEKTFTAILLCQPFLIWGAVNSNNLLTNYGFELYDELFDYDFDKETNDELRLTGLIYNIIKYKDQNYNKLRLNINDKIIRNRNVAIDIIKNEKFIPDIILDFKRKYDNFINIKCFYEFLIKKHN